ncbi:hypothetical protein PG987_010898 [Apiospora arundinis]
MVKRLRFRFGTLSFRLLGWQFAINLIRVGHSRLLKIEVKLVIIGNGKRCISSGSASAVDSVAAVGSAAPASGVIDLAATGSSAAESTAAGWTTGSAEADSVVAGSAATVSSFSVLAAEDSSSCDSGTPEAATTAGSSDTSGEASFAASAASDLTSSASAEVTSAAAAGISFVASSSTAGASTFSNSRCRHARLLLISSIDMLRGVRGRSICLGRILDHVKSGGGGIIGDRHDLPVLGPSDGAAFVEDLLDESLRLLLEELLLA